MSSWVTLPEPFGVFDIPADVDPHSPGVYSTMRSSDHVYVGMAGDVWERLSDHRRAGMLTFITTGAVYPCQSVEAAARLERALIWLLDPSENVSRPGPSGPLWAATLGMSRPIQGWRWFLGCGHVQLGSRTLVDKEGVARAGCLCTPWTGWLRAAQIAVAQTEADAARALERSAELTRDLGDADNRAETLWVRTEEMEAERVVLREEIDRLQDLLDRADWTP